MRMSAWVRKPERQAYESQLVLVRLAQCGVERFGKSYRSRHGDRAGARARVAAFSISRPPFFLLTTAAR